MTENDTAIVPKGYFAKGHYTYIDLDDDGTVSFQTDRECETATLSKNEAKQLFLAMMNKYKAEGDIFWSA